MAGSEDRKAELIAQLGAARRQIDRSSEKLRAAVDVPARVRHNFSNHLFAWLGGATLFGILLAKVPARKKKVYVDPQGKRVHPGGVAKAGFLVAGLKVAFDLARPFLLKLAAEKLRPMAEQYFARQQRQAE